MEYSANPNPNPNCTYFFDSSNNNFDFPPEFEWSDYLMLDDHGGSFEEDSPSQSMVESNIEDGNSSQASGGATSSRNANSNIKCKNGLKSNKFEVGRRIAFRTKSELEVMDDGFKWRKYGKKSVKNSPNPRNYFKCSSGGCRVKKRIQRDGEDSSYVITTYEGVHNHESPSVVYYNQMPLMVPNGYTLLPSPDSSTSS